MRLIEYHSQNGDLPSFYPVKRLENITTATVGGETEFYLNIDGAELDIDRESYEHLVQNLRIRDAILVAYHPNAKAKRKGNTTRGTK